MKGSSIEDTKSVCVESKDDECRMKNAKAKMAGSPREGPSWRACDRVETWAEQTGDTGVVSSEGIGRCP